MTSGYTPEATPGRAPVESPQPDGLTAFPLGIKALVDKVRGKRVNRVQSAQPHNGPKPLGMFADMLLMAQSTADLEAAGDHLKHGS